MARVVPEDGETHVEQMSSDIASSDAKTADGAGSATGAEFKPVDGLDKQVPEATKPCDGNQPTLRRLSNSNHQGRAERAIRKVKTEAHLADEEDVNPIIDIFIRAKLQQWDKDHSGSFGMDEVKAAMDELQAVSESYYNLKLRVLVGSVAALVAVSLAIGIGALAYQITRETHVSQGGQMEAKRDGLKQIVVTTDKRADAGIGSLLSFDVASDEWSLTDNELRDIDEVMFSSDGNFYKYVIADIARRDTGSEGTADKLDISTTAGHRLRFYETIGTLEIQWAGSAMWHAIDNLSNSSRRLEYEAEEGPSEDSLDDSVLDISVPEPPGRLLAKGGGGGYGGRSVAGTTTTVVGGYTYRQWNDGYRCRERCSEADLGRYSDCCNWARQSAPASLLVLALVSILARI